MIRYSLNELTKKSLMGKSKKDTPERFARRSDSGDDWYLERVGVLELESGSDDLYLYFKVKGQYKVSVIVLGFKPILEKYINGKYKKDKRKAINRALVYGLNYCHIKTSCSCPDFRYRFAYMATKKKYGDPDTKETRPAKITNPKNRGGMCKHQLRVLSLPSKWRPKVVTALMGYLKGV